MFRCLVLMLLILSNAYAGNQQNYYRTFWNPAYQGHRLDYCMSEGKVCGFPVANRYCQLMGYEQVSRQSINYNVRMTQALSSRKLCRGWQCNGFTLIRCMAKFTHKPVSSYYYRSRVFEFPCYNHGRVDWCYEDGKGCGQRAATSFCRRMGYERAKQYKIQAHVSPTRAIGNHKMCVGDDCNAFSHITCYR